MKSKEPEARSIREATENRARWRQFSGHPRFLHESILVNDLANDLRTNCSPLTISKLCSVLVLLFGLPAVLFAQSQPEQWSDLNRLKAGQRIEVIESNLKRHAGEFVSVTDELLTLHEGGSDVSINRGNIVRVSKSSASRRGEHAVIGFLVGGGLGAAVGAAAAGPSSSNSGWFTFNTRRIGALLGVAIGAPSGGLIGAAVPSHKTLYRGAPVANTGSSRLSGVSRPPVSLYFGSRDSISSSSRVAAPQRVASAP